MSKQGQNPPDLKRLLDKRLAVSLNGKVRNSFFFFFFFFFSFFFLFSSSHWCLLCFSLTALC